MCSKKTVVCCGILFYTLDTFGSNLVSYRQNMFMILSYQVPGQIPSWQLLIPCLDDTAEPTALLMVVSAEDYY